MNNITPAGHLPQAFTPEYVLEHFVVDDIGIKEDERTMTLGGVNYPVYVNSQRYLLFKRDGLKCVRCDRVASVCFLAEPGKNSKSTRSHFNFFSVEPSGKFILFTKDHKVARANGGRDVMENYVPMCQICNTKKGCKGTKAEIDAAINNGTAVDIKSSCVFVIKIPAVVQASELAMQTINTSVGMMDATLAHISDSRFNVVATRNPKFVERTLQVIVNQMHNIISCKPNSHSTIK